jgi:hypothetical protein
VDVGRRIDNPEDTLPSLVAAVLAQKKKNSGYGEFVLRIVFKDGKPADIEVTDKATYKQ